MILRPDLIFSYWIFIWYIFYVFNFISYSPKIALFVGLLHNIVMLLLMISYGTSYKSIINFIIINTTIKIIPLYYLLNEKIKIEDIYFTFILFYLFIFWLHINQQNLIGNMKLLHDSLLYEQGNTPLMSILNKFKNNLRNM
jgi:hypothetical protein